MAVQSWQNMALAQKSDEHVYELFHENSKIGRLSDAPSALEVRERMAELQESLEFTGYPLVELPRKWAKMKLSLASAILTRTSVRHFSPCRLTLREVSTLLHYAYGITRHNQGTDFPRPFRVVPSGGALYPLEIFLHSPGIQNHPAGLYHYNPTKHCLRHIRQGDETKTLSQLVVFPDLVIGSSLVIFLTAVFERSTFKYGDRGYRFVLLETGHVAQNLNVVSNGLGLGSVNIGGFYDREIDEFLGLDGITHSTIYIISIGKPGKS